VDGSLQADPVVRPTITEWAFQVLESYAKRGTCIRRKAGALALDEYHRIIGLGMNGVPRGMPHCIQTPCAGAEDPKGDTRWCLAIHAEVNMIMNAISSPTKIVTVYTSVTPCFECAKVLANLPNLKRVISMATYADRRGVDLLVEAGIEVHILS
jgi:dCMP deaminase